MRWRRGAGRTIAVAKSGGRLQAGLGKEALRERGQIAVGQIEFDALDAVHRKENDGGCERLAIADHNGEVLERGQFGATQAEAGRGKRENHSPEFFAWIAQRRNHEGPRLERFGLGGHSSGGIKVHAKIVAGESLHCKLLRYSRERRTSCFGSDFRLRYAGRTCKATRHFR